MAKHIKECFGTILSTKDWKTQLLMNWPTIIGDLKNQVVLEKVDDHSLVLGTFSSSWMQELYLLSPLLLATINKHLDYPRIKFIRFKIASTKKNNTATTPACKISHKKNVPLSQHEQKTLETIQDEQLRNALKDFLIRCRQEK